MIAKIDAALLKFGLSAKRAVFTTSIENPLYRQRSINSSYYMPRVWVYGNFGPLWKPSPCNGKTGDYTKERKELITECFS